MLVIAFTLDENIRMEVGVHVELSWSRKEGFQARSFSRGFGERVEVLCEVVSSVFSLYTPTNAFKNYAGFMTSAKLKDARGNR